MLHYVSHIRAHSRRFGCVLFLTASSCTAGETTELYLDVESYTRTEPMSAYAIIKDFRGPLSNGRDAITHSKVELGFRKDAWAIAIQERNGYELQATQDFVDGYYALKNDAELNLGRTYQLQLKGWHLAARGLRIGRRFELTPQLTKSTIELELGVVWLQGDAFFDGALFGTGFSTGSNRLDFSTTVDYQYSRDILFDRDVEAPAGWGLSTDLQLRFTVGEKIHGRLKLDDIGGFLQWRSAPRTKAIARSDRGGERPGGGLNPLVTGVEDFDDFRQRLPVRMTTQINWQHDSQRHAGILMQHDARKLSVALVRGLQFGSKWQTEALLWPSQRALGLTIKHPNLTIRATTDHTSPQKIRFGVIEAAFRVKL